MSGDDDRKKRFIFSEGDELLLLQTILAEKSLWTIPRGQRMGGWNAITAALNALGIPASTWTIRQKLKRLIQTYEDSLGERSTELTELEKLVSEYLQRESQFHKDKKAFNMPKIHQNLVSFESGKQSTDRKGIRTRSRPLQDVPAMLQLSRKKRSPFDDSQDLLLLKTVLNYRSGVRIAEAKKHNVGHITAALKSQGLNVTDHSIRGRLEKLVKAFKQEARFRDDSDKLTEKEELIRAYCESLEEGERISKQSSELNTQSDNGRFDAVGSLDIRSRSESEEIAENPIDVEEPPQSELVGSPVARVIGASQGRASVATRVQVSETTIRPPTNEVTTGVRSLAALSSAQNSLGSQAPVGVLPNETDSAPATQASTTSQSSPAIQNVPATQEQQPTPDLPSTDTPPSSQALLPAQPLPDARMSPSAQTLNSRSSAALEDQISTERASKRQKVDLEEFMVRFLSKQSASQMEEQAAKVDAFQEQQRQTHELHKQALNMQQTTANLQGRIMRLMERVMDTLD